MSRRRALTVLPLVVFVAALAACTESARIPPPEPTSATQPLFATDEEALEAATEAYEAYLAASNEVTSSADAGTATIQDFVTSDYFEEFQIAVSDLRSRGLVTQGASTLVSTELQQIFEEGDMTTVVLYVCLDVSGVQLLDSSGTNQTPADRDPIVALEVSFVEEPEEFGGLLISTSDSWAEGDLCGS